MKEQSLRLCGIAFVVLLLAGACTPAPPPAPTPTLAPPTPTPGPVDRVMAFQSAFNKPAIDEAAAQFLDDKVGVILQGLLLSDSLGVRDTLDYATATGLKLEFSDCKPEGEAVNCQLLLRDDACLKSFGLDPVHDTARIKFQDGKVNLFTTEMATEEAKRWFDAQWQLDDWIRLEHPDVAEKLTQLPGPGNTAKQQGELLAQLCKDWAAAPANPTPPAPPPDPVAVVKAWAAAMNTGDVDAAIALLTDDVQRLQGAQIWGSGKNEVGTALGWMAGLETKFQIEDCQPADDRVECALSVVDACIAAFGAPAGLPAKMEFSLQDGKMRQFSQQTEGAEWATSSLWWEKARAWAKADPAGGWARFDELTREGGENAAKLCRGYAASLKAAPPTPAADLVAPVKAYVAALNAGDVDAALALFTDDVKWGDHIVRAYGKEQLRAKLDWLIAEEVQQQITDCQPQADRVICHLSRVEACTPAPGGTDGLPVKLVFIYGPDGNVRQAEAGHDGPQWDEAVKWWEAQAAWAQANRADEWGKAQDRTKEGGLLDAKLCKEYAATLGPGDKIQNAMSAAPVAIAVDATIVDWPAPGGDMAVLRKGTNDWTCYPDWTVSPGNDPECNDPVMEAWFRALLAGEKEPPPITGPGIAYMLMGGSDPSNTDPMAAAPAAGEDWVTSPAHVMLVVPGGLDAKAFSTDPKSGGPYIMWDGTPYEHLMVPVVPMPAKEMGDADATMQNAMSAAPGAISAHATILGWPKKQGDPMVVLRKGTNDWTCIADWPASPGNDPACNDPMWTIWTDALAAGTPPEITTPGIAYMLAGGSDPSNTDPMAIAPAPGEDWVNSGPHIMLLVAGGFDAKQFSTDPKSGGPYIMWDGTPYEHLMLPVTDMPQ